MPPTAVAPSLPSPTERPQASHTDSPKPKFPRDELGFQTELKKRVSAYFTQTGQRERDCWRMYLKTAIILTWWIGSYSLLVFADPSLWIAIPLAISLALSMAAAAFNIQHDGGHHAYSNREWINRIAATTLDVIGASSYLWRWKHTVLHHTYPNVDGQDTDIAAEPFARLAPHQKRRWFHRWQHLYLWFLYSLTAARWHLMTDIQEVLTENMSGHHIPRPRGWDLLVFIVGKAASFAVLLVVPMFFHPWWLVLCFYMLVTGVVGVVLTIVFQLAHCVGEAEFPIPEGEQHRMADSWAIHQIHTTVDFARDSRSLCWLLGGLNFQVVHHLFPRICHIHYPALSKIVEQVCSEYGVRYMIHPTFLDGLRSHYHWLKKMGREDSIPSGFQSEPAKLANCTTNAIADISPTGVPGSTGKSNLPA